MPTIITTYRQHRNFLRQKLGLEAGYLTTYHVFHPVPVADTHADLPAFAKQVIVDPLHLSSRDVPDHDTQREHAGRPDVFVHRDTLKVRLGLERQVCTIDFYIELRRQRVHSGAV